VCPVTAGLFHRAILMSGSAMSDWAASNQSLQLTMQIAHALKYFNETKKKFHDLLLKVISLNRKTLKWVVPTQCLHKLLRAQLFLLLTRFLL